MGGYSTRMQQDKAFLKYKGEFWFKIIENKLLAFFDTVYLSLRKEQYEKHQEIFNTYSNRLIFDVELPNVEGPLKGILSVFGSFKGQRSVFFLLQQI
ncbi:MAG: molybdenum cofactor guanylyltransferase [Leptonema sp. (in: bacteria)]